MSCIINIAKGRIQMEEKRNTIINLTRREQEIPHFYKWWDELRYSRRLLNFCISQYYNLIINQSYSLKRI